VWNDEMGVKWWAFDWLFFLVKKLKRQMFFFYNDEACKNKNVTIGIFQHLTDLVMPFFIN